AAAGIDQVARAEGQRRAVGLARVHQQRTAVRAEFQLLDLDLLARIHAAGAGVVDSRASNSARLTWKAWPKRGLSARSNRNTLTLSRLPRLGKFVRSLFTPFWRTCSSTAWRSRIGRFIRSSVSLLWKSGCVSFSSSVTFQPLRARKV